MVFKVGQYYKHTSGQMMHIVGSCITTLYGWCLVAECSDSANLKPVGQDDDNAENWTSSTEKDWMKNFSE